MNDKMIVILIIGLPSIIGMSCILYSIFYEKDVDDSIPQYKPKQPILISHYDDELVTDTEYYSDQESEESNIDYLKEDRVSIFADD